VVAGTGAAVVAYEAFLDDDATSNQRIVTRSVLTPPLDPTTDPGPAVGPGPELAPVRTGGGGCACTLTPASGPAPLPWLAIGLWWRRCRRRRSARAAGRSILPGG
jgi:MYXO-CTERM domain-containing protein